MVAIGCFAFLTSRSSAAASPAPETQLSPRAATAAFLAAAERGDENAIVGALGVSPTASPARRAEAVLGALAPGRGLALYHAAHSHWR